MAGIFQTAETSQAPLLPDMAMERQRPAEITTPQAWRPGRHHFF